MRPQMFIAETGLPTMTSLELVEFINLDRTEKAHAAGAGFPSKGHAKLEHGDFLKKVPVVLGERAGNFSATYQIPGPNGSSRSAPIYRLPKREACLMAMSYSHELQAKVYDRMTELERRAVDVDAHVQALSDPYVLRAALLIYNEKVIELQQKVREAAPKVEYADAMLASEGTTLIREAAKIIGVPPMKLYAALKEKGVLLSNNAPAARYVERGYFKETIHTYETNTRGNALGHTARVTTRGLEFLRRFVRANLTGQNHPPMAF